MTTILQKAGTERTRIIQECDRVRLQLLEKQMENVKLSSATKNSESVLKRVTATLRASEQAYADVVDVSNEQFD